MPYKIIIVDDESIIREGLSNFIDWKSIGFEVVGLFEDGKDAIAYIDDQLVDVVVTDIKMSFVSGLELARYIHENKPGIKVVLLSGYREFELAQEAIKYSVESYLLKIAQPAEIMDVFRKLKRKLDNEQSEKERVKDDLEKYNEILPLLKEQFLWYLFIGIIHDKNEIMSHARIFQMNEEIFERHHCCYVNIDLLGFGNYQEKTWKYEKEKLFNAIRNCIYTLEENNNVFLICRVKSSLQVLIFSPYTMEKDKGSSHSIFHQYIDRMIKELKDIFDLTAVLESYKEYNNIYEISDRNTIPEASVYESSNNIMNMIERKDFQKIQQQGKVFLSCINTGDLKAAQNIFDNFFNELNLMDMQVIQNFIFDLFGMMSNEMKNTGIDIFVATGGKFNYKDILLFTDKDDLKAWGISILKEIENYYKNNGKTSEGYLISKAKEYIKENYGKDISLEDVADHIFLSHAYLSRLFKEQTGENFIDYMVKVRIEKAIELLKDPRYKAYEVSSMVGYKSIRYFTKIFKSYTSYTPSQFRSNVLKGDAI